MADQTFSTNLNIDDTTKSGLNNGESVIINSGAELTINSDSRWSQQGAVIGAVTIDSNTGGKFILDGLEVWWIPFDNGSGLVPSLGILDIDDCFGSISGSGEFLGIWSSLRQNPESAGNSMPSTGFIKMRRYTSAFVDDEVVTLDGGATITVNSPTGGQRGWIQVIGKEGTSISIPRLGEFKATGDWFYLAEATGVDDEVIDYYINDQCPAVQVETFAGSGIYEWWCGAGVTRPYQDNRASTDSRGKVFLNNFDGTLVFGIRSGLTFGAKLPIGAKIRVPNIHISSSPSSDYTTVNVSSIQNNRWKPYTSLGGVINLDKISGSIYLYMVSSFSFSLSNTCYFDYMFTSRVATTVNIDSCAKGISDKLASYGLHINACNQSVSIKDTVCLSYQAHNGNHNFYIGESNNVELLRCKSMQFGNNSATVLDRVNAVAGSIVISKCINTTIEDCIIIGTGLLITTNGGLIKNLKSADAVENRDTSSVNGIHLIVLDQSKDVLIDGYSIYDNLENQHPYSVVYFQVSQNCELRNVGTIDQPFDCGTVSPMAYLANFINSYDINIARRCYLKNNKSTLISSSSGNLYSRCINVWGSDLKPSGYSPTNFMLTGCRTARQFLTTASAYGTHWYDHFTSDTTGAITILSNEPTSYSANQCYITSGEPKFTSTGFLFFFTEGDQIVFEHPHLILGITGLANITPSYYGSNINNLTQEFQYDLGNGWNGTWITVNGTNLSNVGVIDPNIGINIKFRFTALTSSTNTNFSHYSIDTVTDAVSQRVLYPLPTDSTASVTNIVNGSRMQIYNETTDTELVNTIVTSTEWSNDYNNGENYNTGDVIRIRLTYQNGSTAYQQWTTKVLVGTIGWSVYASQELLEEYASLGYDGSLATEFSLDGDHIQTDVNDLDGYCEKKKIIAWFYYALTSEEGIRTFFGRLFLEDESNAIIYQEGYSPLTVDNISDVQLQFTDDNFRIYTDDKSSWITYPSTGGYGITSTSDKVYPVSVNGISPSEAQIKAWIRQELSTEMSRIDAPISSRSTSTDISSSEINILSNIDLVKSKTDNLPSDPARESTAKTILGFTIK